MSKGRHVVLLWCVSIDELGMIERSEKGFVTSKIRPASDDSPPSGPSGIGRAAIENETSRSRLWSLSSEIFSSSNVSMTGGGC